MGLQKCEASAATPTTPRAVSAAFAFATINYDELKRFFCPSLKELKQVQPVMSFHHVAKRLALSPQVARKWETMCVVRYCCGSSCVRAFLMLQFHNPCSKSHTAGIPMA
jgi:hypothetical protein